MSTATETVHDRVAQANSELTATKIGLGLAILASIGFVLLFLQAPLAHDAMHNFRHAAGITCH
jgi:hypothetical protein